MTGPIDPLRIPQSISDWVDQLRQDLSTMELLTAEDWISRSWHYDDLCVPQTRRAGGPSLWCNRIRTVRPSERYL